MSEALHRAIRDALRDGRGYEERGILPAPLLEATLPLHADDGLLYQAVYTVFIALPGRLLPGSVLRITTEDVQGGVRLRWTSREVLLPGAPTGGDLRAALAGGTHGDLVEIALHALERFCSVRAGFVEVRPGRIWTSSSFQTPDHVEREVEAFIPMRPGEVGAARGVPVPREVEAAAAEPEDAPSGGVSGRARRPLARRARRRNVKLKAPTI